MSKNCTLVDHDCKENCERCGWNPTEAKKRRKAFIEKGLTLCEDGLKRLVIKRED